MYGVHIEFDDGSTPIMKMGMSRSEYSKKMRNLESEYQIKVERVEELSNGEKLIFARATEKWVARKNLEKAKSRARYYSRRNG